MKTKITLGIIMLFCLALAGCADKDAEFKAFTADFEKVTTETVAKIEANPTESGVDEAHAFFDGKKADLKTNWAAIKEARGGQVSQDVLKDFEDGVKRSGEKVTGVMSKLSEPEALTKYQKLVKDWSAVVGAGGAS